MLNIEQVNVPRAAHVLADLLREKIFKGELAVGAELPAERDLAERAGVSRATVREALRLLESDGLVITRVGRKGGSEVVQLSVEVVERSLQTFIRGRRIRLDAILETRAAIEGPSAAYAAAHRTEEDLDRLELCHERVEKASKDADMQAYLQANLDWHIQVVQAGHNELLVAFMSAIAQPIFEASDLKGFISPQLRVAAIRAHRRVIDAIRERDGEAARRRMERHVDAYVATAKNVGMPAAVDDIKEWTGKAN